MMWKLQKKLLEKQPCRIKRQPSRWMIMNIQKFKAISKAKKYRMSQAELFIQFLFIIKTADQFGSVKLHII